jgi:hypothetical protein
MNRIGNKMKKTVFILAAWMAFFGWVGSVKSGSNSS